MEVWSYDRIKQPYTQRNWIATDPIYLYGATVQGNMSSYESFSVPLDQNTSMKETEKVDNFMPLICELEQLHREHAYKIIPISVVSLEANPKPPIEH